MAELQEFQARDMMPLLNFLLYMVDTMRENNIVWGVGRGSSVASYVLYLIGVHRINSMKYNLDYKEFFR
jgi:DNA polymerase III alpha subunit